MNSPVLTAMRSPEDVFNQVPPLTNYNLFVTDGTLVKAMVREGAAWAKERISELGRLHVP